MEIPCPLTDPTKNKREAMVLKLTEPLLDHGHTFWMDNCFNSPNLAYFLKTKGTDCVGTLCVNIKNVPLLKK
jgi:hypothetical protein